MFNYGTKTAARIRAEVVTASGVVRESLDFTNIMTNLGLLAWASGNLGAQLAIGAGSRAVVGSITSLASFVKSATGTYAFSNVDVIDTANGVMRSDLTLSVSMSEETANQNYSELGIFATNANQLQTYSLIKDAMGNPTTLSVLTGEFIRVTYKIQFSIPLLHTATQDILGEPRTVSVVPIRTGQSIEARRPPTLSSGIKAIGAPAPVPAPGTVPAGGQTPAADASISGDTVILAVSSSQFNFASGIALFCMGITNNASLGVHVHIDPPILKTAVSGLRFSLKTVLSNGVYYES